MKDNEKRVLAKIIYGAYTDCILNKEMTEDKGAKDEAKEFILEQLREHDGPMDNTDLRDYVIACGISSATFDRAKSELKKENIITIKINGFGKDKISQISLIATEG